MVSEHLSAHCLWNSSSISSFSSYFTIDLWALVEYELRLWSQELNFVTIDESLSLDRYRFSFQTETSSMAKQGRHMRTWNTISDSEASAIRNRNQQSEQDDWEVVAVQSQLSRLTKLLQDRQSIDNTHSPFSCIQQIILAYVLWIKP